MLFSYPAYFFKDSGGYCAVFPDLNGLTARGATQDEAFSMAVNVLAGYLYWSQKDGGSIPAPSAIEDIRLPDAAARLGGSAKNAFVNLVAVDMEEYAKAHFEKSVKKTLTIPAWLNVAALEQGINFSQVLQEALKEKLGLKK